MISKTIISIIVPFLNEEKYIAECIESALNQSYTQFELILVNDGSTDSSKSICESYKEKDDRIKLINLQNGGVTRARKKGWEASVGEWICFADGDDKLTPDSLEILYKTAIDSQCDIVKSDYSRFPLNDRIINKANDKISQKEYLEALIRGDIRGVLYAALYKKSLFSDTCFDFDPSIKVGEDVLSSITIGTNANSIYSINKITYNYRTDNHSVLKQNIVHPRYFIRLFNRMKEILPNNPSDDNKRFYDLIDEKKYRTVSNSFFSLYIKFDLESWRYLKQNNTYSDIKNTYSILLKSKLLARLFKWLQYNSNLARIKMLGRKKIEYKVIY